MSNVEEDIKRCEKLTEPQNANWIGISNQLAIVHLIERIKELEEQVKILDEAYTGVIKESKKWFDIAHSNIPKQKVKDKIEELKKEYEIALEENSTKAFILKCKISAFEELLEEK